MAVARVGTAQTVNYVASLTVNLTTSTGSCLVLAVLHQSRTVTSVTDTAGNTWTLAASTFSIGASSSQRVSIYYCLDAATVTSATVAIDSAGALAVRLTELTGVGALLDTAVALSGRQASSPDALVDVVPDGFAVGVAGVYVVAGGVIPTSTATGWTGIPPNSISTTHQLGAYRLTATTGTGTPRWGAGNNATFGVAAASFSPAAPPVTPHWYHGNGVEWVDVTDGVRYGNGTEWVTV